MVAATEEEKEEKIVTDTGEMDMMIGENGDEASLLPREDRQREWTVAVNWGGIPTGNNGLNLAMGSWFEYL